MGLVNTRLLPLEEGDVFFIVAFPKKGGLCMCVYSVEVDVVDAPLPLNVLFSPSAKEADMYSITLNPLYTPMKATSVHTHTHMYVRRESG
jgi:hypothetical protein